MNNSFKKFIFFGGAVGNCYFCTCNWCKFQLLRSNKVISVMKRISLKFLAFFALLLIVACSDDSENVLHDERTERVSVTQTNIPVETRAFTPLQPSGTESNGLYSITYKSMVLRNVPLSINDVNMLRKASSVSAPVSVSLKGYAEWTVRTTGHKNGNWYKLAISSKDPAAQVCGIAPGVYIARDVWLLQYYTLPSPNSFIIPNDNYEDYTHMGAKSDSIKSPGYTWSVVNGTKVTLQTAATLLKYTLGGAEVLLTYPVKGDNLEWNFSYVNVQI